MKIILSRKGFDGNTGGFASPIMPCGRLLSLPIPVTPKQMANGEVGIPYADLRFDGQPLSEINNQLCNHNHQFPYNAAHLDPDLDRGRLEPREQGWKRTFGQQGRAQADLKDVKEGDLFLFFGWFRRTRYENSQLRYLQPRKCGKDLHVIFGWLQIGEIHPVRKEQHQDEFPKWLHYHPHIVNRENYGNLNTIYIAADELIVSGQRLGVRGAGTFPCFKPSLQLTAQGEEARAHWCLPKWLCKEQNHGTWPCREGHVPFDSYRYRQKQEFVFAVPEPDNQEVMKWLNDLFEGCC
jgi:hypothetical protein